MINGLRLDKANLPAVLRVLSKDSRNKHQRSSIRVMSPNHAGDNFSMFSGRR